MPFLAKLITTSLAIIFGAYLLPGVHIDSALTAILLSLVLSLLNVLLKPLLIVLTLPFTIITLGLFLLVINAVIIMLAAELVNGFVIDGFWWALIFSVILTLVVSVLEGIQRAAAGNEKND
ncbi:MAG: phage holin family protein [Bacteroidetes bacterium]|nr:phage holin family protein [Bacteroidota bacterium]